VLQPTVIVLPDQPITRRPLAAIAPGLVETAPPNSSYLTRLTDSFHLNLTGFGLLSFVVGRSSYMGPRPCV
jgi:putative ABC transport system permease protein